MAMGKQSTSTPAAPDPYAVADAQTKQNEQTAQFNAALMRYNQYTPQGNSIWQNNNGTWTNTQTLNPAAQQILNNQQAGQSYSTGLENQILRAATPTITGNAAAGLPGIQSSINTDFANQVNQAQNSAFNQQMSLLQPQMQQQQESLQSQLAAEGLPQGSEAYNNAINNQARQNNFTISQAANNAVQTGNALQNQLFGQQLQGGQFQNQANAQQLQQNMQLQDQPLQIWQAVNGMPVQMGNFWNQGGNPQAANTDISSDIYNSYQGNVNAANAKNASANSTTDMLGSVAGMAAMMFM
jgi:hypothetical protein